MRLLVTGGAGFIGSNFIRYLLRKYPGYRIINLDKLTYAGNSDNLSDIKEDKNYTFVKGDICDAKTLEKCLSGCDCLINFAAHTHVDRSISDASDFLQTNIIGTYTLLEAARRMNIKLFLQISTDEVYGSVEKGRAKESDPLMPNSPYSASKAAADHLVRSYCVTYGLAAIISRCVNNFGPYQYPEKVIPLFITNLLEGKRLPLYGDGLNKRDWIYVLDNCSAIDTLLHRGKVGEVYNIGIGREMPNIILTRKILKSMRMPEGRIQYVLDRPGHDRRYALNIDKLKSLGWKPKFTLNEGLELTIGWYKNNTAWWKKLKK
jgi:dTDP-glucose 4,6-dehydratase